MQPAKTTLAQAQSSDPSTELSPEDYGFLSQYIHRESGIALGEDKLYLLRSRLRPVLGAEGIGSLHALCLRLRHCPSEQLRRNVVESMTTHETMFFRDPPLFDVLRSDLIPELMRQRKATTRTLRIWSAACSSGQESYSVAMLLLESGLADWNLQIIGTDLSSRILERAEQGRYYPIEISRGLPPHLLAKYFHRAGPDWQIGDEIRRLVRFSSFDLRHDMSSLGPFDLVLCRNVLIYFDPAQRTGILSGIRGALGPLGHLLLGTSETTFAFDGFTPRRFGNIIAYQNALAGNRP